MASNLEGSDMDPTFNVYSDGLSGTSSPSSNLYFANLPLHYSEQNLEELLLPWPVISTKILRTMTGASRGVGFALLHCRENCSKVIQLLNGAVLGTKPLTVKLAHCEFPSALTPLQLPVAGFLYFSPMASFPNCD